MERKKRVFVAIGLPEELKERVRQELVPFFKSGLARVVPPENLHLTLAFCGYLSDDELGRLEELASQAARRRKKFTLKPKRIIFAPPNRRPRMVWLTFEKSPEFEGLAKEFAGFADGGLKILPHTTLVRFKDFHYPNLKNFLPAEGIELEGAEPFLVEKIEVMESILSPNGPEYKLLGSYDMM